jgi:pheromone shutdown-related protein TraB
MPATKTQLGNKELILVGTAHVSKQSVEEVKSAILENKPDIVAVELCQARYSILKNPKIWSQTDIVKVIKEKKALVLLANLVMASFQKRIGDKLGIKPGEEIRAAVTAAEEMNIEVALIDRNISVTLQRLWHKISFKEKVLLMWDLLNSLFAAEDVGEEDIEKLKSKDALSLIMEEIGTKIPTVKKVLLDERDMYMAKKIADLPDKKVLAVVGAGHTEGILDKIKNPIDDISVLEYVPQKKKNLWGWIFSFLILTLVGVGFFHGGNAQGYEMIKWWFLSTMFFTAIATSLALAHPVTILVATIVSPLTTLNPALASGWFAGLSEAYFKRPKVSDFETLSDDILSIKGFWKNAITRILIIVTFANIGSSIGVFVAMPILTRIVLKG